MDSGRCGLIRNVRIRCALSVCVCAISWPHKRVDPEECFCLLCRHDESERIRTRGVASLFRRKVEFACLALVVVVL